MGKIIENKRKSFKKSIVKWVIFWYNIRVKL